MLAVGIGGCSNGESNGPPGQSGVEEASAAASAPGAAEATRELWLQPILPPVGPDYSQGPTEPYVHPSGSPPCIESTVSMAGPDVPEYQNGKVTVCNCGAEALEVDGWLIVSDPLASGGDEGFSMAPPDVPTWLASAGEDGDCLDVVYEGVDHELDGDCHFFLHPMLLLTTPSWPHPLAHRHALNSWMHHECSTEVDGVLVPKGEAVEVPVGTEVQIVHDFDGAYACHVVDLHIDLGAPAGSTAKVTWGAIRGSSAAFVFRWLRGGPEVRIEPGVRAVLRLSHDDRSGAFGTSITPPPQGEPRCARL